MAILDIFKKKKAIEKPKEAKKVEKVEPKVAEVRVSKPKKVTGFSYNIVKKPHISEKATDLGTDNQYVFEVFSKANKSQIKKAIESFYGVSVLSVNIVRIPAKKRRIGRNIGFKGGCKKAIVKIKQGQKIEII